ncbi:MAG: DNA-binding transcriptional dual regulator Crp [Verrucomicrobia bacterium ADurb.Bin345]|nr:MAG: DNA-binding transcriptional dual regulator Crp [Verrucomicrobia bacterium ADurb.Bin345]
MTAADIQHGSAESFPGRVLRTATLAGVVVKESVRCFIVNRHAAAAATLAYYGFLALMPLMLLVVFVMSLVVRSSAQVLEGLQNLTSHLFPVFGQTMLQDVLAVSGGKIWGAVSFVILLWSVTPFAAAVRNAMFDVFRVETGMRFWKAKLFDVAAILALLALFLFLAASRILRSLFPAVAIPMAGMPELVRNGGVFLLSVCVLVFFYKAFAPVKMELWEAAAGAFGAAALLAVIRPLFGLVLRFNPDYGYAFGSLKTLFLVIVWVYYTFAVLLLGAGLVAAIRRRDALLLRGLFLGRGAGRSTTRRLLNRFVVEFGRGEKVFDEGSTGKDMFYVASGEVEILKGARRLAVLGEGEYFGEMSMLLGAPRTAAAKVMSDSAELVRISMDNFDTILREEPRIVRSMLTKMAERLEATNRMVEGKG